jgi:hypothetical protein
MNLLFKQLDNNLKNKKEKVWECKNMQEKNMHNMKKSLINKREEKMKFKNNMKDLTVKPINNNNK